MVEVVESVEVVKIPGEGLVTSVDFKGEECLVASGVAGRFEDRSRAVLEAGRMPMRGDEKEESTEPSS